MSGDRAAWLMMSDPDRSIYDRVQAIFHYNRFHPDPYCPDRVPAPFHSEGFRSINKREVYIVHEDEGAAQIRSFCTELFDLVDESPLHTARLDRKFSELLECDFQPTGKSSPFHDEPSLDLKSEITKRTLQILERLPKTPLELPGLPSGVPAVYISPSTTRTHSQALAWDDLQVASYLSTNVIRVALCVVIHPWIAKGKIAEFANHIASFLQAAAQLSSSSRTSATRYLWFVVRSFLWTSWQRTVMLYFFLWLAQHLESGVDDEDTTRGRLESFSPLPGMSLQEMSKQYAAAGKSHYMCAWAFQLLRTNRVCIHMDFRKAHRLYCGKFDSYAARCTPDRQFSCKGDHPHSCQRFVGMVIKNQSAHDRGCTGCKKLTWDEASFRSTPGAKAVSLDETVGKRLRYRTASKNTLAISHVWSHGQGGRPETGMNHCLHERYKSIARSMGCDSYWMDTPCIPTDHVLRREAIMNINKVFAQSKATLVCDRDLMEIEVDDNISVQLRELILITAMTCDWNVRAWTFLEAFRARQSIHLLCKDNRTVSLRSTVEIVHHEGSLDIGALLLTVPHLLPGVRRQYVPPSILTPDKYPVIATIMQQSKPLHQGFLTVENSAMYLSHRPASRPGDDIVIWSLLLNEKVYDTAIDFWRSRQENIVDTSFLVSTTPRLNIWRFGWAPASPRIFLDSSAALEPRSMGINGITSRAGSITAEGLLANWLFCRLGGLTMTISKVPLGRKAFKVSNVQIIRKKFLQNYRWGALLRPLNTNESIPAINQDDISRVLVVVCGTNDFPHDDATWGRRPQHVAAWEWMGVHEWDTREPLPDFREKRVLLV